jgi:hypothetical protein
VTRPASEKLHAPLTNIPFLFGLYPGLTGGGLGFLTGNVTDDEDVLYRHCGYDNAELASAFTGLTTWISTGQRAAGDQILDPRAVSSPYFGCRFTVGTHPFFSGPTCPAAASGPGRRPA